LLCVNLTECFCDRDERPRTWPLILGDLNKMPPSFISKSPWTRLNVPSSSRPTFLELTAERECRIGIYTAIAAVAAFAAVVTEIVAVPLARRTLR
jgi:hypothetical protein